MKKPIDSRMELQPYCGLNISGIAFVEKAIIRRRYVIVLLTHLLLDQKIKYDHLWVRGHNFPEQKKWCKVYGIVRKYRYRLKKDEIKQGEDKKMAKKIQRYSIGECLFKTISCKKESI